MAVIRMMHWNMETYGPTKFTNGNNAALIQYIARLVHRNRINMFVMVEVKNSVAPMLPGLIAVDINAIQGIPAINNPWRSVYVRHSQNHESNVFMFRTDQNFLPARATATGIQATVATIPDSGPGMEDRAGNRLNFPTRFRPTGGRRPGYATFRTTDTNNNFSIISYHAMDSKTLSGYGVNELPDLNYIYEFADGPPATAIACSLISGDFNVQFDPAFPVDYADYQNMLNIPTTPATTGKTTLKEKAPVPATNDPASYLASAYDNIFRKVPLTPTSGGSYKLLVGSAVIIGPAQPPPAVQPGIGGLSAAAAAFNPAAIHIRRIGLPVPFVPPTNMLSSWAFVRQAISNHYPVYTTVTI